jgi:hypothetical protein
MHRKKPYDRHFEQTGCVAIIIQSSIMGISGLITKRACVTAGAGNDSHKTNA